MESLTATTNASFASVKLFATGTALPAITGLIVLAIAIALAIKAVNKFGRKLV